MHYRGVSCRVLHLHLVAFTIALGIVAKAAETADIVWRLLRPAPLALALVCSCRCVIRTFQRCLLDDLLASSVFKHPQRLQPGWRERCRTNKFSQASQSTKLSCVLSGPESLDC